MILMSQVWKMFAPIISQISGHMVRFVLFWFGLVFGGGGGTGF
jgi:hypothetical protein